MRKLIVIVAVLVLLAGGWVFASPWIAMDGLRDAAREADQEALEQRIDFPALRADLKADMRKQVAEEAKRRGVSDTAAGLGDKVASGFIDGIVDAVITPRGMASLLVTGSLIPRPEGHNLPEIDWHVERTGLDSFRAVPKGEDGQSYPALVFHRDGLSWKLAEIDIPESALEQE